MEISAVVENGRGAHCANVATAGAAQPIGIRARASGQGSAVNGGELLMLALATCYCNDLYREATQLGIAIERVEVEAKADFGGVGMAAKNVRYRARIESPAPAEQIEALLDRTDAVAEVHNTLRAGAVVARRAWDEQG
ncbi:MAG TPA: OsmC family protein [Burkholderiaceae bacterium]|nr:OsmC family protein [Burkholderiaceae bacterium]HQR71441.1 OsmC family protein [Burkholderiaceae bacterium]